MDKYFSAKSVFMVKPINDKGVIWLKRIADIKNGILTKPKFDENMPGKFENREYFRHENGPKNKFEIGIWDWIAEEDYYNKEKEHAHSYYNDTNVTEIYFIENVSSLDDIKEQLLNGVEMKSSTSQVLFSYKNDSNNYFGILCKQDQLDSYDANSVKIKNNVYSLPVYKFDDSNIFDTGYKFLYKNIDLGNPYNTVLMQDIVDIIKECFISKINWQAAKSMNISRSEWQKIKSFVDELVVEEISKEVSEKSFCNEEEAKKHIKSFIECADKYINQEQIENHVLNAILESNDDIKSRLEEISDFKFNEKHKKEISNASKEIETLKNKIDEKETINENLNLELEELNYIIEKKQDEIRQCELLGNEICDKMSEKIAKAKDNVADFVSSMAFVNTKSKNTQANSLQNNPIIQKGEEIPAEYGIGTNTSYKELLENFNYELYKVAHISTDFSKALAIFIYSAYKTKRALLLAGPCADSIANSLSSTMFGKKAGIINCIGKYKPNIINEICESKDEIFLIKDPFNPYWVNYLPDILAIKNKFFFISVPYDQDLLIEPKSLYQYVSPIITEPFVEAMPIDDFDPMVLSDNFKDIYEDEIHKQEIKLKALKDLKMSRLIISQYQTILAYCKEISPELFENIKYLFVLFPYAYVMEQLEKLSDIMENDNCVPDSVKRFLLDFIGEDDE